MTNVTLVIPTNIVSYSQVVLVISFVVKLRLAPLTGVGLHNSSTDLGVGLQIAVADELFFAVFTLEALSLRQWNVFLKVSHDLKLLLKKNVINKLNSDLGPLLEDLVRTEAALVLPLSRLVRLQLYQLRLIVPAGGGRARHSRARVVQVLCLKGRR